MGRVLPKSKDIVIETKEDVSDKETRERVAQDAVPDGAKVLLTYWAKSKMRGVYMLKVVYREKK